MGIFPEKECFRLESRHLGLVTPAGADPDKSQLQEVGMTIAETVDLSEILKIAEPGRVPGRRESDKKRSEWEAEGARGCCQRLKAFCFYYKENMKLLEPGRM